MFDNILVSLKFGIILYSVNRHYNTVKWTK